MLNITRIHNSLGASGALGRGLKWARSYARVREVFGLPLHTMPAHRATLADLAVDYAASRSVLRCCELTGRHEHGVASEDELAVLRCLTPVTKLTTGRWSIAGVTEAMEAIGGCRQGHWAAGRGASPPPRQHASQPEVWCLQRRLPTSDSGWRTDPATIRHLAAPE
ncbi:MAG: hypothetical protein M3343_09250 [Actinomycetota bacterium]|nr:hypothetical protein [Actinomycetota bacterium]